MPTNDDRREVAARLRECVLSSGAAEIEEKLKLSMTMATRYVMWPNLVAIILPNETIVSLKDISNRLADLIEPEPERACEFSTYMKDGDPYPTCSACGYESDAYECRWLFDGSMEYSGKFCVNCGARVKEG